MKKRLLFIFLFFASFTVSAQITFEPGYFINNEGNRTDCLIKNKDRTNNPTQFEYKVTENSPSQIATIENVKEYEILNTVHKYQRFTVNIDCASDNIKDLSYKKEPEFKREHLFLRVLVSGQSAALYAYNGRGGLQRFFFTADTTTITQLVYKKYVANENQQIKENTTYKQQLWTNFKCPSFTIQQFDKIAYEEKDLVETFVNYNKCMGTAFINHSSKMLKGKFAFRIKAGLNSSELQIDQYLVLGQVMVAGSKMSTTKHATTTFGQELSPKVGLEIEYAPPINKYKWSLFAEPTFQYFKTDGDLTIYKAVYVPETPSHYAHVTLGSEKGTFEVDYAHITLPIGVKHYFFLNFESKLFLSGAVATSFLLNSSDPFKAEGYETKQNFSHPNMNLKPSFILAMGYKFQDKISIELDYSFGKRLLEETRWETRFNNSVSMTLGYSIFK